MNSLCFLLSPATMDWHAVYLICFGVGLVLSIMGFVGGGLHMPHGMHFGGHGHAAGKLPGKGHGAASAASWSTAVAFLCWFGGTGFVLASGHVFTWLLVLALSALSGLAGAGLVFWFVARVLLPRERVLEPADTPIIGVLGRVSAAVPATGVGEMLYTQGGARRSMPIAADDGVPIRRHAEVVVLRYARGVAYVRRWDEMQQSLLGDEPMPHGTDISTE